MYVEVASCAKLVLGIKNRCYRIIIVKTSIANMGNPQ